MDSSDIFYFTIHGHFHSVDVDFATIFIIKWSLVYSPLASSP